MILHHLFCLTEVRKHSAVAVAALKRFCPRRKWKTPQIILPVLPNWPAMSRGSASRSHQFMINEVAEVNSLIICLQEAVCVNCY